MRRFLVAVVSTLGAVFTVALLPGTSAADISLAQTNQVTLSCSDGHSAVMGVDSSTLTSLAADVQALEASGGPSCTLNTTAANPSAETTDWTVYDYNASDREIAPRNSPGSMPATTSGTTTMFNFLPGAFTALLTTTDPSLTGDLSGKTLSDDITLNGPATTFMTQNGGGDCVGNTPAAVRFYFVSPSASGPSTGTSPPGTGGTTGAGFYTKFWWSNPVNEQLLSGNQGPIPIAANMDPSEWSDWNGQQGDSSPAVMAAFEEAIRNVQSVGLSFGGECFFETGVTAEYPAGNPPPYETFSSNFTESP